MQYVSFSYYLFLSQCNVFQSISKFSSCISNFIMNDVPLYEHTTLLTLVLQLVELDIVCFYCLISINYAVMNVVQVFVFIVV